MLIVAFALAVIFLLRDVQILAVRDRRLLALRFGKYAMLLLTGIAIFAGWASTRPVWTNQRFALGAIIVQLSELAIGFALKRYALGCHDWVGCILPFPAFLAALFVFSVEVQNRLHVGSLTAIESITAAWLATVGVLVAVICWMDNPGEDRRFASDFALMTSCTALIFVPFGLS